MDRELKNGCISGIIMAVIIMLIVFLFIFILVYNVGMRNYYDAQLEKMQYENTINSDTLKNDEGL